MLYFDNSTLPLPVRPGDDLYYVDKYGGYTISLIENGGEAVVLTADNEVLIFTTLDEEPMEIGEGYFLTEAEAIAWRDKTKPAPPILFGRDALKWMSVDKWLPFVSGTKYVKVRKGDTVYVCTAYYHDGIRDPGRATPHSDEPGFYDSRDEDAKLIQDVTFWIDHTMSLDEALEADDFDA